MRSYPSLRSLLLSTTSVHALLAGGMGPVKPSAIYTEVRGDAAV